MSYAKTSKQSSSYISASPGSNVSHFNSDWKTGFGGIGHQMEMAMLSVRVNRFEKKAGRKMNFNNRDAARFDKKKIKELEQDKLVDPKALLSVDSMVKWSDHEESADENASQVYGMIARRDDEDEVAGEFALMGVTSQVQTCPFGCHNKYAELKREFDDLEVQYKEYYIQV
ncbi:hypothetical protein Tco_0839439 [Tanacetum coccineum]|uniref:Uncharacterized protein n=1 Tax=Tanacetum coccineum TaxID=301880 RepID=A0ABQ5ATS4_9ASTR